MSFKIYSIESRKGGVGKTTIALNLAHALTSKGPVLLLDCDITGTSISEPALNSPFWHEYTNVLNGPNGQPLNLLGYFLNSYIRGNERLDEVLSHEIWDVKKINVIGSDLYDPNLSLVVDTRKLMDDLHTYWFLKYIQHIIKCFERANEGKTVHIIIDNSPGYVGFCETLHSYMFDCGPNIAKFLFVSSADAQDLIASISAASEVKKKIDDRLFVAKYYQRVSKYDLLDRDAEKHIKSDSSLKRFLIDLINDQTKIQPYLAADIPVNKYLSIVLNKVPQSLDDDGLSYDYLKLIGEDKMNLFQDAVSLDKNLNPRTIVYFDEVISYQYYLKYLKNGSDAPSTYWNRRIKNLQMQSRELASSEAQVKSLQTLSTLYQNLIKNLQHRGYKRLAKDMSEKWSPTYALDELQDYMLSITPIQIPYVDNHNNERTSARLHEWNFNNLNTLSSILSIRPYTEAIKTIVSSIEQSLYTDQSSNTLALMIMVSAFIDVFVKKCHHEMTAEESFPSFLIRNPKSYTTKDSWMPYVNRTLYFYNEEMWSLNSMQVAFDRYYNDFYTLFCYAVLRNIDSYNDFETVLSAVSLYVQHKSVLPFSAEMKDYLNGIIVTKTDLFSFEKMEGIWSNSLSMVRIKDMLSQHVIKKWEK